MMNAKILMAGLKANYATGLHPSDLHEQDFIRTLRNMGYGPEQLELLYNELLKTCEFFPKVFDIHRCAGALNLKRPGKTELDTTRELIDGFADHKDGAMTFQEWLADGGMDQIMQDCNYDERKIAQRLAMMGVLARPIPDEPEKSKKHKSDFEFIAGELPSYDFPERIDDL
jgi:hypothetical protein